MYSFELNFSISKIKQNCKNYARHQHLLLAKKLLKLWADFPMLFFFSPFTQTLSYSNSFLLIFPAFQKFNDCSIPANFVSIKVLGSVFFYSLLFCLFSHSPRPTLSGDLWASFVYALGMPPLFAWIWTSTQLIIVIELIHASSQKSNSSFVLMKRSVLGCAYLNIRSIEMW